MIIIFGLSMWMMIAQAGMGQEFVYTIVITPIQ